MGQIIAVTVKEFTVTESIDPKSRVAVPLKYKPKVIAGLEKVEVDPPKGKTLHPYSADVVVTIKKVEKPTKGVRAEVKINFSVQDPYSKKDLHAGAALGGATVPTDNPDAGDADAAVDAAVKAAIKTAITAIQDDAKKP